jgi:hypothetical protein
MTDSVCFIGCFSILTGLSTQCNSTDVEADPVTMSDRMYQQIVKRVLDGDRDESTRETTTPQSIEENTHLFVVNREGRAVENRRRSTG